MIWLAEVSKSHIYQSKVGSGHQSNETEDALTVSSYLLKDFVAYIKSGILLRVIISLPLSLS